MVVGTDELTFPLSAMMMRNALHLPRAFHSILAYRNKAAAPTLVVELILRE
jgi:hypothetical protein